MPASDAADNTLSVIPGQSLYRALDYPQKPEYHDGDDDRHDKSYQGVDGRHYFSFDVLSECSTLQACAWQCSAASAIWCSCRASSSLCSSEMSPRRMISSSASFSIPTSTAPSASHRCSTRQVTSSSEWYPTVVPYAHNRSPSVPQSFTCKWQDYGLAAKSTIHSRSGI